MAVPPEESPSPVIPLIVLLIVGAMMMIPAMMTYDPTVYWTATIAEVQTHFIVGAFLIPVCLLLAVQAFGMPKVNHVEPSIPSSSPFVESISQDLPTSVTLVAIIFFLLMIIPLRNVWQGPWQPPPTYPRSRRWW